MAIDPLTIMAIASAAPMLLQGIGGFLNNRAAGANAAAGQEQYLAAMKSAAAARAKYIKEWEAAQKAAERGNQVRFDDIKAGRDKMIAKTDRTLGQATARDKAASRAAVASTGKSKLGKKGDSLKKGVKRESNLAAQRAGQRGKDRNLTIGMAPREGQAAFIERVEDVYPDRSGLIRASELAGQGAVGVGGGGSATGDFLTQAAGLLGQLGPLLPVLMQAFGGGGGAAGAAAMGAGVGGGSGGMTPNKQAMQTFF